MTRLATISFAVLILFFMVVPAEAQRGGDRGGRGGFGGGDFRARILERMDANGNGIIEPDEAQGRAQGFVERMARDAGLEPGRPLPISRLTGSSDGSRDDRSRGNSNVRSESNEDEYPTIPAFGDEAVQKFGISPLTLAGKIVDLEKKYDRRVLDSVNRTMERYDKNKNGILDHNEWSSVSWRGGDPRESDLDKDGILTKAEMAERTANRYSNDDRDRDSRSRGRGDDRSRFGGRGGDARGREGSGGGDRGRGGFGGFAGGGEERGRGRGRDGGEGRGRGRGGFGAGFDPTTFIARMDQNGDGKVGPDEVDERRRAFFQDRFQIDLSKPIEIETIRKQFQQRNAGDRNSRDKADDVNKVKEAYRVEGSERLKGRKSYRSNGPGLPAKLPDWWNDRDNNSDGQVTLAEFAKTADARIISEFADLDLNGDGLITAKEAALDES